MIDTLPTHLPSLLALVFLLGLKHGFDADHLATIDGMTRLNLRAGQPGLARACGALFSLGHGVVVVAIAAAVSQAQAHWAPPGWLDALGAWVSIAVLLALGAANLHALLATPPGTVVAPVGFKGRILGRWTRARHPLAVAGVGALFALSFDTVSQATLFALTGAAYGGLGPALGFSALFVAGMLATDALNGWWIARLIARADQVAALASRLMSLAVAVVSLALAGVGIARLGLPGVDAWAGEHALWLGGAVLAVLGASGWWARASLWRLRSSRR